MLNQSGFQRMTFEGIRWGDLLPVWSARFKGRGQKGQAIVEYVLILVGVLVLGNLALQLNEKIFKKWGTSVIQDHIICMLEAGKLPNNVNCDIKTVTDTIDFAGSSGGMTGATPGGQTSAGATPGGGVTGATPGGTDPGGGHSSNSSGEGSDGGEGDSGDLYPHDDISLNDGNNGNNAKNEKGGSSSKSGRSRKGKSSSSSQEDYNPNGDRISINPADGLPFGSAGNNTKTGRRSRAAKSNKKQRSIKFSSGSSAYNGEPGYEGQLHQAVLSGGWMEQDEQRKTSQLIPVSSTNIASKNNKITGSDKRNRLVINKKLKTQDKDIKIKKWSFGNIFRVVLIICVIVAIVLLIGSQTYSVKKSMK